MAVRKFDGYRVNVTNMKKVQHKDGTIRVSFDMSGNIEIGLEIERMTWREDWALQQAFKDDYSKYEIISLNQCPIYDSIEHIETNHIEMTVRPR